MFRWATTKSSNRKSINNGAKNHFADEPTGSLDSINAKELMVLFRKINKMNNTTIVMVTHDSFGCFIFV